MMVLSFLYLYITYYNLGGLAGLMIIIISVVTLMPFSAKNTIKSITSDTNYKSTSPMLKSKKPIIRANNPVASANSKILLENNYSLNKGLLATPIIKAPNIIPITIQISNKSVLASPVPKLFTGCIILY